MRFLLAPLSWLYSLYVHFRNWLYDENILKSRTVSVPTICVGNLTVGGAGKTPHTEYIAGILSRQFKVAILSRGYKRKTSGFVLADEHSTVQQLGDEAMQMHLHFPDIPVAVAENRVRGINELLRLFPDLQCVILDDGYQHRRLRCGFYVLLTPFDRLYVNDHLVPWGRLREPADAALRANAVVVTKCSDEMQPIEKRVITSALALPPFMQLYFSSFSYGKPYPVFEGAQTMADDFKIRPIVITGIAHPEYLAHAMTNMHWDFKLLSFPDHHRYNKIDVKNIMHAYKRHHANCIITTEKDAVRLRNCKSLTNDMKRVLYALPISVDMQSQTDSFAEQVITYVTENNRS